MVLSKAETEELARLLVSGQQIYQRLVDGGKTRAAEFFRRAHAGESIPPGVARELRAALVAMIRFDAETVANVTSMMTRQALELQGFTDLAPERAASVVLAEGREELGLVDQMDDSVDKFLLRDVTSYAAARGIPVEQAKRIVAENAANWAGKYYHRHMDLARGLSRRNELRRRRRAAVKSGEPRQTYFRVTRAEGACPFCILISDRAYYVDDLLPVHPHCRCEVVMASSVEEAAVINGVRASDVDPKYAVEFRDHAEFGPQMVPKVLKPELAAV